MAKSLKERTLDLMALRSSQMSLADRVESETEQLRAAFRDSREYSPELSWLSVRTTWQNTRPGREPIQVTCEGCHGIRSALIKAASDLAWPRQDPHSRAVKVDIYFTAGKKIDLFKSEEGAFLIASIAPPWQD